MQGITDDHQFKTKNGWKYFHEIDIEKDELYCWRFKAIDDDCSELLYEYNYLQEGKPVKENNIFYINSLKKNFHFKNNCDLIQIKNEFIDITATANYNIPVIFIHGENRYDNWSDLEDLKGLYERVIYLDEVNKKLEWEHNMSAFSETLIKKPNHKYYTLSDITFKLHPSHFTKIISRDRSIVSFLMPKLLDKNVTWRIYARRNGKEFWV